MAGASGTLKLSTVCGAPIVSEALEVRVKGHEHMLSHPRKEEAGQRPVKDPFGAQEIGHTALMATHYYRRSWNESRGDQYSSWGPATYYFEIGDDGRPSRQIEVYDSGPTLRYNPGHEEDEFGLLAQEPLAPLDEWHPWAITEEEFEQAWHDLP